MLPSFKAGSASFPFFGIKPELVDADSKVLDGGKQWSLSNY